MSQQKSVQNDSGLRPPVVPPEDLFKDVRKYYDRFYSTTDFHYALWDSSTRSARDAIRNTNRIVCELLVIRPGDAVLDAGSGVGGTSIYLAQQYGARVEGIDASQTHVEQARANATAARAGDQVRFSVQDHRHTAFAEAQFDHVVAIESVVASDTAADFLREAHRVLRPEGSLAIATMHLRRSSGGSAPFKKRHAGHAAFEINRSAEEFCGIIAGCGFQDVRVVDLTDRIRLVSKTLMLVPLILVLVLSKLRLVHATMGAHLETLLETERAIARKELGWSVFLAKR